MYEMVRRIARHKRRRRVRVTHGKELRRERLGALSDPWNVSNHYTAARHAVKQWAALESPDKEHGNLRQERVEQGIEDDGRGVDVVTLFVIVIFVGPDRVRDARE